MSLDANFAALIGSRICHDLISPIGAINNGLELIGMTTPSLGPEMALISESVTNASARIRFFRIAFGAVSEQLVGRPEVVSILKDVYAETRLTVNWTLATGLQRREVRLAFLALMCLETGMPYGGRIEVAHDGSSVILTGHADKFKIEGALWDLLEGAPQYADVRPAHVQFGLLPVLTLESGFTTDLERTENMLTIRLSPPRST
ncbi:histidine phosphotransferase family protein [Sulfitobacter guttiformis]|uniref:Histidine phosphotransferase ChpT n=1 Tax=Sulfitobacter guttiformis TaxID=74349 RepID=A0A420DHU8_9RHOB|nr:histidine phosphotransferase family protein [Sulfitobacter guttiformis]KIN72454.1 hypothetical protein Z949_1629 [Sulfitobacter guttiformis KCTC 32187]RKE93794.1 histidine phosphotransferase ChpT [Sulfitobacter guttiformis]